MSSSELDEGGDMTKPSATNKRVAVIGASLGGLVAAAELKSLGFDPVIIERGKTAGGLFNKVETPFGVQEMGMHVVYVAERHYAHLAEIFGSDMFNVLTGCSVDIGASYNFGKNFFNSMYPCLLHHEQREKILSEIISSLDQDADPANAAEELDRRFGKTAGTGIVAPILEKLWLAKAEQLTKHAIHCFFDLRRIVVCDKPEADKLKKNTLLDSVIANPQQLAPHGNVFGGRMGLTFRHSHQSLAAMVNDWCERSGITIRYGCSVTVGQKGLSIDGGLVADDFDACLVTMPVHSFAPAFGMELEQIELSIYYFELDKALKDEFPAYYILCHDPEIRASRIVNYDAYNPRGDINPSVVAIEVVHPVGLQPDINVIASELMRVVPCIKVNKSYLHPVTVKACVPSLNNARMLDLIETRISDGFSNKQVYFTGMRTDTGIFFSHHTIGLAHESALECAKSLS